MEPYQRRVLLLLGGLVVLVWIGALSSVAYFLLSRGQATLPKPGGDPISQMVAKEIEPSVALLSLADVADRETVNYALAGGELESAYATVVFSTNFSDGERAGRLLLLASRYALARNQAKAKLCYQQATTIATLSPTLSDFARANIYLQIGQGLADLGQKAEALFNYDQAYNVALYSPYFQTSHRRYVLDELARAYKALGEKERTRQSLEERAATQESAASVPASTGAPYDLSFLSPSGQELTQPEIDHLREQRTVLAQSLVDYLSTPSGEIPSTMISDLAQALQAEDAARAAFYDAQLTESTEPATRAAIAQAKVNWLTIKYRVALRGYGLSFSPDWEAQVTDIRSDLNRAYEELYALYGDQAIALPEASQADRAWADVLRRQIELGRLGLYPDPPEEQLVSALREATQKLIETQRGSSLRVDVFSRDGFNIFVLTTDEFYGIEG